VKKYAQGLLSEETDEKSALRVISLGDVLGSIGGVDDDGRPGRVSLDLTPNEIVSLEVGHVVLVGAKRTKQKKKSQKKIARPTFWLQPRD
jgi:hypothetical protein